MANVKPTEPAEEDLRLIRLFREGDQRAFDLLVERYQQRVFNIIRHTLGMEGHADDLAQEIFIRVYYSLSSYQERSAFSTWLYRITVNMCIDEARRTKRSQSVPFDESADLMVSGTPGSAVTDGLEKEIERNEMKEIVHRSIAELPEQYRVVVTLRDINGLSYEEIAAILKCRVGTVKSRLFNARMKLRQLLSKYL